MNTLIKMRFEWIILVLSLFVYWWIHEEDSPLIDFLNCAMRRGIYNKSSGKCTIIKFKFVSQNKTTLISKGNTKKGIYLNKTSKKKNWIVKER